MKTIYKFNFLILTLSLLTAAYADEPTQEPEDSTSHVNQMVELANDIDHYQALRDKIESQIKRASEEDVKALLSQELETANQRISELRESLEDVATGSADISLFNKPPEPEEFKWQDELEEVFTPVVQELKRATERPRQIEKLRSQIEELDRRLNATETALQELNSYDHKGSPSLQKSIIGLEKRWSERKDQLDIQLQLAKMQLQEKLNSGQSSKDQIITSLKEFVTGRGLHILIAIGIFSLIYLGMNFIGRRMELWISRDQESEHRLYGRLVRIVFQVVTFLIASLAALATFYVVGDFLLLTIILIIIVALLFALRNSLPQYIDEVKLLLNLGAVKEGERVIYNGLPWKVTKLNLASTLVNPALSYGVIRLPMRALLKLISRPASPEEPWFPSNEGDYVLIGSESFGQIILQTPELVQHKLAGSGVQVYSVADYLSACPVNLSIAGFDARIIIGLDYSLQAKIVDEISTQLKEFVKNALDHSEFSDSVQNYLVEFESPGSSSLNLELLVNFNSQAAPHFLAIKRFLHSSSVQACNHFDWEIPYSQLKVHMSQ